MELKYHYEYLSHLEKKHKIKLNTLEKFLLCSIIENKNIKEIKEFISINNNYNSIQAIITLLVNKKLINQEGDNQLNLTQPFVEMDYITINLNLVDKIVHYFKYKIDYQELIILSILNEFKYLTIEQFKIILNINYTSLQQVINKLIKKSIIKTRETLLLKDMYYLNETINTDSKQTSSLENVIEDLEERNSKLTTQCTDLVKENITLRDKVLENASIITKFKHELNLKIKTIEEMKNNLLTFANKI
jgi:hypothetical protein